MALIETSIAAEIYSFIKSNKGGEDFDVAIRVFSDGLAKVIVDTIKTATVTLAPGSIITVGSDTTQTNATPAIGILS